MLSLVVTDLMLPFFTVRLGIVSVPENVPSYFSKFEAVKYRFLTGVVGWIWGLDMESVLKEPR